MNVLVQALKSRTVWLGIVTAILSVLQAFLLQLPFPPLYQAIVGCAIGAAIIVLRFVTDKALSEK